jgi:hypothetical protein
MNCGCVAAGDIKCDKCQRLIEQGQRYLFMEGEKGKKQRFCVECCLVKGYAAYVTEKGEKVLTFFPTKADSEKKPS